MKKLVFVLAIIAAGISHAEEQPPYEVTEPGASENFRQIYYLFNDLDNRTVKYKDVSRVFNVRDYGAYGNGTSDDTSAIRSAVTSASNAGGGTVYFPAGSYAVSNTIYWPSRVKFQGDGIGRSTITVLAALPTNIDVFHINTATGGTYGAHQSVFNEMSDLTIDCTLQTAGFGAAILAAPGDYVTINRVHVKSSQGYGIYISGDTGTKNMISPTVSNNILEGCGRSGGYDSIAGGQNTGAKIIFNTCHRPTGTCIDNVNVDAAIWEGNISTGAAGHAGQIWSDFGMTNSRIVNNYIQNGSIHVYGYLSGTDRGTPSNVLIQGNTIINGGSSAILVSPANQISSDTGMSYGIRIIGNVVDGCIDDAITIQDSSGTIIMGNHLRDWGSDGGADFAVDFLGGPNTSIGVHKSIITGNYGGSRYYSVWYNEAVGGGAAPTNGNYVYGNNFDNHTMNFDNTIPQTVEINFSSNSLNATGTYKFGDGNRQTLTTFRTPSSGSGGSPVTAIGGDTFPAISAIATNGSFNSDIIFSSSSIAGSSSFNFLRGIAGTNVSYFIDGLGGYKIGSRTLAQIQAATPSYTGLVYYCSDCTTDAVCISTGTSTGSFSRITARTTACQ